MAADQFIVVVYDISNDRRRTRLHERLKDFGTPVQYSVFECLLDAQGLQGLKKAVRKIIRPKQDHVRYYVLCNACRERIEASGGREITSKEAVIVV
jgi:CRISPR-associated protein Cas2